MGFTLGRCMVCGIGDIRFGYWIYLPVLAEIILRDLFPKLDKVCKILRAEQRGAVSWILEWILKGLEGVELHQGADEKSSSQAELLSALRFCDSRNKVDRSPLPYILIWIRLLEGLNLLTRLGSSPNLGFFGVMAESSCVPAPVINYILLLG